MSSLSWLRPELPTTQVGAACSWEFFLGFSCSRSLYWGISCCGCVQETRYLNWIEVGCCFGRFWNSHRALHCPGVPSLSHVCASWFLVSIFVDFGASNIAYGAIGQCWELGISEARTVLSVWSSHQCAAFLFVCLPLHLSPVCVPENPETIGKVIDHSQICPILRLSRSILTIFFGRTPWEFVDHSRLGLCLR